MVSTLVRKTIGNASMVKQRDTGEASLEPSVFPRAFVLIIGMFLAGGGILLLAMDKRALHIMFNGWWTPTLDAVVPWVTLFGDGLAATVLSMGLLLLYSPRAGLVAGLSALLTGIATQLLKHFVFADAVRPFVFFRDSYALHFVPGVEIYSYNSFPSGHAATAIAICFSLAILSPRGWVQVLLALLGLSVALSRVYLSQHFFGDVYAGVIIGLGAGWTTAVTLRVWRTRGAVWLDRPLLRF
jgi:membrane-associated phospholipid phosphatase